MKTRFYIFSKSALVSLIGLGLLLTLFLFLKYCRFIDVNPSNSNYTIVEINYLVPMENKAILKNNINISSEYPQALITFKTKWLSPTKLLLQIRHSGPKGQLITIEVNDTPTVIPFLNKDVKAQVREKVPVKLINDNNKVPTPGPVTINFNTPIDENSLRERIILPKPGLLKPIKSTYYKKGKSKEFIDYSRWQYIPDNNFSNNKQYQIVLQKGILSKAGSKTKKNYTIRFITAPPLKVISTKPTEGSIVSQLYQPIIINLEKKAKSASVTIKTEEENKQLSGKVEIDESKIIFRPQKSFLPGTTYYVRVTANSIKGETLEAYHFSFKTSDMGDKYWVDVTLADKHTVDVYKGSKLVKHMLASGGKSETPTPIGYFYTQDRGYAFWSPRFGEGATYWVRLVGQVLVHSVPRDSQWRIKMDEHDKLGLPASHGCIRLTEEDAKWFYENMPRGTLVIIHH